MAIKNQTAGLSIMILKYFIKVRSKAKMAKKVIFFAKITERG